MTKTYSGTKHLYTLNDSKLSESEDNSSLNSSIEEEDAMNTTNYDHIQKDYQKLTRKNDDLQRTINELQLKNQQLYELTQLSDRRNTKHEQKQRELIKKLSYFQVNNKQLTYELKRITQQLIDSKQNKKISQNQINEVKLTIKKSLYDKERFVLFLKHLFDILNKCNKIDQFQIEKQRILQLIQKNMMNTDNSNKINCDFDLKFDNSRIDTLKQKNKQLEEQLQECKITLQQQRNQKKKMTITYNQKINKLRQLYDTLKLKVEQQQQENRRKIKGLLLQKNQTIESLKNKLKESRINKSSLQAKQSREGRKNFIGDGEYSHLELNELNEAIENLEIQIIKEFEE